VTLAPLGPVVVSCEMSSTDPSTGKRKYSFSNASHMRTGEISVPVSSLIVWIVRENSIWSRRGRSKPCSAFMM
jgi:hypothetical protein